MNIVMLFQTDSSKILKEENDDEMREMQNELDELISRREEMDEEIKILLIPKDPEDSKLQKLEERRRHHIFIEIYINGYAKLI